MGIIIAKFRKSQNSYQLLEKLQNEITEIEEFSKSTEKTKKRIIGRFIALALTSYLLLALGVYFYYHKISPRQKLIYTMPFIVVPVVTYVIKCFLTWYYGRKIRKNQLKLTKLKGEKKRILEKVEETETYNVAKEILNKFGEFNKPIITIKDSTPLESKSVSKVTSVVNPTPLELRKRTVHASDIKYRPGPEDKNITQLNNDIINTLGTPSSRTSTLATKGTTGYSVLPNIGTPTLSTSLTVQLPRPVLPLRKTIVDKMFDYLVGDGPSNRYALICKNCFRHNGMAFKEEFEYLSFSCCYCGSVNPSSKKRPSGPKFEPTFSPSRTLTMDSSDSDVSSDESSKPIITYPPNVTPTNSDYQSVPSTAVENTINSLSEVRQPLLDSQSSTQGGSKNPFGDNANSYEDGDSRYPVGENNREEEETTKTQHKDLVKPQTKED